MSIAYEDFARIDIRVGTVVDVAANAAARTPAYVLTIDFGPGMGLRTSSAQLTTHYRPAELLGRQVAAVVNLPPRKIADIDSQVLVLGFPDARGAVVLVTPDRAVPNGGSLY